MKNSPSMPIRNFLCLVCCLSFLQVLCGANALANNNKSPSLAPPKGESILVVGATGSTGLRAIQGLLDVGFSPNQIRLLTRNENSDKSNALRKAGFGIVQADLEDLESLQEKKDIIQGCFGCYVHSTSSDIPELDKGEVQRAINLAIVLGTNNSNRNNNKMRSIVYNSAAAHDNHGVGRIQQKHDVEEVFRNTVTTFNNNQKKSSSKKGQITKRMAFTSLRANIFMEELWKRYTRPQILDGTYPLPLPGNRKIYLTSVRDMGRLAGTIMIKDYNAASSASGSTATATKSLTTASQKKEEEETPNDFDDVVRILKVAGDYLSAKDIANAFERVQGSTCRHHNPRLMTLKSYFYFPELYEQIRFLQTFSVDTDVDGLRDRFPNAMTTFEHFLRETHWEDKDKTFADFADTKLLEFVHA